MISFLLVDIYFFHGIGVIIIIIIIIDVAKECLFCKVGLKEYSKGGAVNMYIRLLRWLLDFVNSLSQFRHGLGLKGEVI